MRRRYRTIAPPALYTTPDEDYASLQVIPKKMKVHQEDAVPDRHDVMEQRAKVIRKSVGEEGFALLRDWALISLLTTPPRNSWHGVRYDIKLRPNSIEGYNRGTATTLCEYMEHYINRKLLGAFVLHQMPSNTDFVFFLKPGAVEEHAEKLAMQLLRDIIKTPGTLEKLDQMLMPPATSRELLAGMIGHLQKEGNASFIMRLASDNDHFELAAITRDHVRTLGARRERQ